MTPTDIRVRRSFTDAWGVDHEWVCTPFATLESIDKFCRVWEVVTGGELGNLDAILDTDVSVLQDRMTAGGGILSFLAGVPGRLVRGGGGKLIADLLTGCRRETAGKYVPVTPDSLDAFGRGNLQEVFAALVWVLEVNWAPFVKALFGALASASTAGDARPADLSSLSGPGE